MLYIFKTIKHGDKNMCIDVQILMETNNKCYQKYSTKEGGGSAKEVETMLP